MRRAALLIVVLTFAATSGAATAATASETQSYASEGVYATVTDDAVVVGNAFFERSWTRRGFATTTFVDKRTGADVTSAPHPDFALTVGAASVSSTAFEVTSVDVEPIAGGLRASMHLSAPGIEATRVVDAFGDVAGLRAQTLLHGPLPGLLRGFTLEEIAVGDDVRPTLHAFRAGADWREPDWGGPRLSVGDPHAGTWRDTTSGDVGEAIAGPGHWLSVARDDASAFVVMERNDWPSSRAAYSDGVARLEVDHSRDLVIFGPFEEDIHAENPTPLPARHRAIAPGETLALPASFTGVATDADDEPWQFYKYLSRHRLTDYDKSVVFNSNGTDDGKLSAGAKDDMDFATLQQVAPVAKAMGIETFILDDGWQAISGDWHPDCPDHPEPRWDGDPNSQFKPRFPDCDFRAVRDAIAPMELGLWMSPMHFHPASQTYRSHPEWACTPVGHGTASLSVIDPHTGSNDAGLGTWGPDAIPHVEARIRHAIEEWDVSYFKFDFLVWLDCAGQGDLYDYHDAFVAMVDRLQRDYPGVTFQIDETNDYRMFPFESVSRGPSWFQNGSPPVDRLLHNLWNLSPYVPAYSLGQHFLGSNECSDSDPGGTTCPIDTRMAAALPSHMTYFSDLREIAPEAVDRARTWIDFYKAHRDFFAQMTFPLLEDPIEGGWTALQSWDPEANRGALLAFRQRSEQSSATIALRAVSPGATFDLVRAPTGETVATVTSEELARGIDVSLPPNGAEVLLVIPRPDFDPTTELVYDGDRSVRVGGTAVLAATLRGSDGPVPGALVSFTYRGQTLTATTDHAGRATTSIRATGPPGDYPITARFAGTDRYSASETSASLRVTGR